MQLLWKQYGGSSKIKTRATPWYSNSSSGYSSEEGENTKLKRHGHSHAPCCIVCDRQHTQNRNVCGQRSKETEIHTEILAIKIMKSGHLWQYGWTCRVLHKMKPVRGRQTPHDLTYSSPRDNSGSRNARDLLRGLASISIQLCPLPVSTSFHTYCPLTYILHSSLWLSICFWRTQPGTRLVWVGSFWAKEIWWK